MQPHRKSSRSPLTCVVPLVVHSMHAYVHQVLSLSFLFPTPSLFASSFPRTSQLDRRDERRSLVRCRPTRNEMNHRSQICTTSMISVCLRMRLDKRLSNDKQAFYQGRSRAANLSACRHLFSSHVNIFRTSRTVYVQRG